MSFLSGCSSNHNYFTKSDSNKIDSIIRVRKVNSHTLLVNFGYDAITAIETDSGIVIIDAGISTGLTARYKKLIEKEFHNDNYIYLINTHWHPDHTGGNKVFQKVRIIGQANFSNDSPERFANRSESMKSLRSIIGDYEQQLLKSNPDTEEWNEIFTQKIRYLSAYNDLKNNFTPRLPDTTFADNMTIETGTTKIELFYFGKSHSNSDILIYIPELKLIFTGDLFSSYGRPGFNVSAIDSAIANQSIAWLQKRLNSIEIVIEGHGQILSKDDIKRFNSKIMELY